MSLASLFASHGFTPPQVAVRLKSAFPTITARFFDRVDQRSQALPMEVANAIAAVLVVPVSEVVINVRRTSTSTGELAHTALPPLLGSSFEPLPLAMPPVPPEPVLFTPNLILGQLFFGWYRSDFNVGVFGGNAISWGDRSGRANNLSTPEETDLLTLETGSVKSIPAVVAELDGTLHEYLLLPSIVSGHNDSSSFTFIFAINPVSIETTREQTLFEVTDSGNRILGCMLGTSNGAALGVTFGAGTAPNAAGSTTGMQILAFVFDAQAQEVRIYRNRVLLSTGVYNSPAAFMDDDFAKSIGGTVAFSWDGELYEALCFARALDVATPTEWQRLHTQYLLPRYLET